jgi:hypothetical protein
MNRFENERLLIALARGDWGLAESLSPAAREDPEGFIEVCRRADLLPWLHALLEHEGRQGFLGAEVQGHLDRWRTKIRQDNLLLLARTEEALDLLLAAGVVPVALKGLDLLHRIYSRFDERTLTDVDLLIPMDQLAPAMTALRGAGWDLPPEPAYTHYVRSSHHLPIASPGPIVVDFEIHWSLAQETRFTIDPTALYDRAVEIEIAGRKILRLEDHDLVAHLLLHHFTHYFDWQLKWAVDMHRITRQPGFDWKAVADRIRSWNATIVSGYALLHLKKIFPDWIPDSVMQELAIPSWRRALTSPLASRHPLELFRNTRSRRVQLYLAAVMLENPASLPRWLIHRAVRDRRPGANPLDSEPD